MTVAAFHAVLEAEGELLLSAMLMPAVSPNILATFTFSSVCSVVCHCCLREKWGDVVLEHVVLRLQRGELRDKTGVAGR